MANEQLDEREGSGASKGNNKLVLIIALSVLLVGGAGLGAFFLVGGGESSKNNLPQTSVGVELDKDGKPIPPKQTAFFYEVPEILVNLSSAGNVTRYLKLKVSLEVRNEAELTTLQYIMPRIVDDFQLYLRQLRVEDLNGSAGIYRLKEDLMMRANQAAAPLQISNVLFREILVQ